ncbi:MAG: hypothetical protein COB96_06730 [Planctomycetota bacterium]|nr:MAG: hypothetical protein COB96_06730 [Planctomycetota bacterium]
MLLASAILLAPLPQAEPEQSAEIAWQQMIASFEQAEALEARIVMKVFLKTENSEPEQMVQESTISFSAAKPAAGQVQMRTRIASLENDKWVWHESWNGLIGDGKLIHLFDGLERNAFTAGKDWASVESYLPNFEPLKAWAGTAPVTPENMSWADDLERGNWRGISFDRLSYRHVYWLDKNSKLRLQEMIPIGIAAPNMPRVLTDFAWLKLKVTAESASYAAKLPANYKLVDAPFTPSSRPEELLEVGATAPDIGFRDLDGKTVRLADFRGRTVLLNFWFLNNSECQQQMPELAKLQTELETTDKKVVILCINRGDQAAAIRKYWKKNNFSMQVLLQSGDSAALAFRVSNYPANFLIDPEGKITYSNSGWNDAGIRSRL